MVRNSLPAEKITILIPAAGYGTRVGSPESKELLILPEEKSPLIDWSLDLSARAGWSTHVVTRSEKPTLIDYLTQKQTQLKNLEIQLIRPSKEWPDTLLQSQRYWSDINIVLLPDTRFSPTTQVSQGVLALQQGADAVFGIFSLSDASPTRYKTWGIINQKNGMLCEKPQDNAKFLDEANCKAWGFFGFRKHVGNQLLSQMLQSTIHHHWFELPKETRFLELEWFEDKTRVLK